MPALHNADEEVEIAGRLRICEATADRLRGLLGVRALAPDEAVWIRPCNAIHTFFMRMTIDVAFVDGELRVVKVIRSMTPWRMCLPVRGAVSVFEGPVGMIDRGRLRRGVRLRVSGYGPGPA